MPNDSLAHVPGGTFFFSVITERNMPIFRRIMSDIGPHSGPYFAVPAAVAHHDRAVVNSDMSSRDQRIDMSIHF